MSVGSSSSGPSRHARKTFEEFVRRVLAIPKGDLDARLDEEKRAKREPRDKPPTDS
jgi:hypothetical protein